MRLFVVTAIAALLIGCASAGSRLEPQPLWIGECIESSGRRVEAAYSQANLSDDGASLVKQLLHTLPEREIAAVNASLTAAQESLGRRLTMADAEILRGKVARQAFRDGFNEAPTCDTRDGFATVDFFTSSVIAYLYKRNVDVTGAFLTLGSPPNEYNTDHEELKVWLLLGAAGAF